MHGVPKIIVSGRDPIFIENFWIELFYCFDTQLDHNSYYHRKYDRNIDILNKCLEGYFRCFASDKHTQWVKWFP
jgi:hypothetical protein